MGALGYGPTENDPAGDYLDGLIRHAVAHAKKSVRVKNYDEARAATFVVMSIYRSGYPLMPEEFSTLDVVLHAIQNDRRYVAGWKNPRKFSRAIAKERSDLHAAVMKERQRR